MTFRKHLWASHRPHAVGEEEAYVVAHGSKQRDGLLVVLLRLPTEASNEVTAQAHPWSTRAQTHTHTHTRLL